MMSMPGFEVTKPFFSFSTQLSMKFIVLINVKMPTLFGILSVMNKIKFGLLLFYYCIG